MNETRLIRGILVYTASLGFTKKKTHIHSKTLGIIIDIPSPLVKNNDHIIEACSGWFCLIAQEPLLSIAGHGDGLNDFNILGFNA